MVKLPRLKTPPPCASPAAPPSPPAPPPLPAKPPPPPPPPAPPPGPTPGAPLAPLAPLPLPPPSPPPPPPPPLPPFRPAPPAAPAVAGRAVAAVGAVEALAAGDAVAAVAADGHVVLHRTAVLKDQGGVEVVVDAAAGADARRAGAVLALRHTRHDRGVVQDHVAAGVGRAAAGVEDGAAAALRAGGVAGGQAVANHVIVEDEHGQLAVRPRPAAGAVEDIAALIARVVRRRLGVAVGDGQAGDRHDLALRRDVEDAAAVERRGGAAAVDGQAGGAWPGDGHVLRDFQLADAAAEGDVGERNVRAKHGGGEGDSAADVDELVGLRDAVADVAFELTGVAVAAVVEAGVAEEVDHERLRRKQRPVLKQLQETLPVVRLRGGLGSAGLAGGGGLGAEPRERHGRAPGASLNAEDAGVEEVMKSGWSIRPYKRTVSVGTM